MCALQTGDTRTEGPSEKAGFSFPVVSWYFLINALKSFSLQVNVPGEYDLTPMTHLRDSLVSGMFLKIEGDFHFEGKKAFPPSL